MARKKKKGHVVHPKKTKNPLHVGTITVEDQLVMDRAARRKAEIESGVNPRSGTGAHGGNKRQRRRKDRRAGKAELRNLD